MRQIQTSINSVAENLINEKWTEAKGVTLSEDWTGTTRFHILRAKLPEGYKRVKNWMTCENPKDYQTRQQMALTLDEIFQETKENRLQNEAEESAKLQAARRNRGNYEVLTDDKDYFKVIVDTRLKLEKDTALALLLLEQCPPLLVIWAH